MKKLVFEFSPLMAILLIIAIVLPVGASLSASTSVYATADNCFITSPISSGAVSSRINGQVPVTFTVGVSGGVTSNIDISIFLLSGTTVVGAPSTFLTSAVTDGTHTFTYNLTIPAGTANGTYGVRVDARHPSGTSTYTSSSPSTDSIVINSTHVPATPSGLAPASASCNSTAGPTFSWSAMTETGYTFKYHFQLSTSSAFSTTLVDNSTVTTAYYVATGLGSGTYYWRVRAIDQFGNEPTTWAGPNSICVLVSNPSVPGGIGTGSTSGYYNPTYSWTASTGASACANVRYCVETSSDSFVTASDNASNLSSLSYTASATLPPGTYQWRVRAYDCAGRTSAWSTTGGSFAILTPVTSASIPLGTGWNLVSLPLCPSSVTSITPAQLLALCDNATAIQLIWGYEAASSSWQYYIPGSGGPLGGISVANGYWIQTTSPANINIITGTSCPAPPQSLITVTLYSGWNLVGFKSCSNIDSEVYFPHPLHDAISFICGYSGGWNCFVPGTTELEPTKGYWVFYGGTTGTYGLPCN